MGAAISSWNGVGAIWSRANPEVHALILTLISHRQKMYVWYQCRLLLCLWVAQLFHHHKQYDAVIARPSTVHQDTSFIVFGRKEGI
jgi:hypothetical protein